MFDAATVLTLLQHGDSGYPAGGFAFSWGVEGLEIDGYLTGAEDLDRLLHDQLSYRWATMDRPCLHLLCADPDGTEEIDREIDRATIGAEMRAGSRRAGRALLNLAARTGGARSTAYRLKLGDPDLGHLTVAQALAALDAGLDVKAAELLSGWTLIMGVVSAAVRIGAVGHVEGQHATAKAGRLLTVLLETQPDTDFPHSFTPLCDIAIARAPMRAQRMFAT